MRKWTKTAGLLFLAAASVYTSRAIVAASEGQATLPASDTANVAFASKTASTVAAPAAKAERLIAARVDALDEAGVGADGPDAGRSDLGAHRLFARLDVEVTALWR
mgnify:CR=1 FL=1